MYGVSATTTSRVPATRPGRPNAGFFSNKSAARKILCTTRPAAAGLSSAIYSASASRLASAMLSHLTRTASPLLRHPLHFPIACKLPAIRFRQPLVYLCNLPAVQRHILPNRLRRQKRPRPPRSRRQLIQLAPQPALQPQSKHFSRRHPILQTTSAYIVFALLAIKNLNPVSASVTQTPRTFRLANPLSDFPLRKLRLLRHIRNTLKMNPVPIRIPKTHHPHPVPHKRLLRLDSPRRRLPINRQRIFTLEAHRHALARFPSWRSPALRILSVFLQHQRRSPNL